jgi:two-component system, NtrC family, sensor kinase
VASPCGSIETFNPHLIIDAAHAIEERVAGSQERGTISISTQLDGEQAVIEISDDGTGIAPGHMDRIYEQPRRAA